MVARQVSNDLTVRVGDERSRTTAMAEFQHHWTLDLAE